MLTEVLNRLFKQETLSREEARKVMNHITTEPANELQVASFLTVYNMRGITHNEFSGFRSALLDLCLPVNTGDIITMDLCGTGGDGKNTFNISTLSSLVAAGAGVKVTKHGNKSVSSKCGSSNVLEHLGLKFKHEESSLLKDLNDNGICFLHAPLFHPALKNLASVRTGLGVKTFINMLGPLVNPARPAVQMAGVFDESVARLYFDLLKEEGTRFSVVYDLNGYDEISLTGPVKVFRNDGEHILNPEDFGLEQGKAEDLYGGDSVSSAAEIFMAILEGRGTKAQTNAVLANSGLAIATYFRVPLKEAVERGRTSLLDGEALRLLNNLTEA